MLFLKEEYDPDCIETSTGGNQINPLPINSVSVIEGVVVKDEYDSDCVETSTGANQINPLNVNIIKVVTIVDKS